jgi:hypothetical protein
MVTMPNSGAELRTVHDRTEESRDRMPSVQRRGGCVRDLSRSAQGCRRRDTAGDVEGVEEVVNAGTA